MPRFGPSTYSPSETAASQRALTVHQSIDRGTESVGLSCLSADGKSVHSLSIKPGRDALVESHTLPLVGTTELEDAEREVPAIIQTKLPQVVQSTLVLDPPLELICVDGDGPGPQRDRNQDYDGATLSMTRKRDLPLLCLYTRKSAFLLHLGYVLTDSQDPLEPVEGEVISVIQPFESHLLTSLPSTDIVRIRPAPQRRMGYATMCPPGSMAMLTNENALVLYHGSQPNRNQEFAVTTPITFGLEELADGENMITDFVFCQSNELSLFASMSVLFLKASCAVLGASPVLFDGAVVPGSLLAESVQYLTGELDRLQDPTDAKWRQCTAAKHFMHDAFGPGDFSKRGSHFVESRVLSGGSANNATLWPVQIQGPLVAPPFSEPDEHVIDAFTIEKFYARGLVGMAIGRASQGVDFAVLSPSSLLPRFAYEEEEDQMALDDALFEAGIVVERVDVGSRRDDTPASRGRSVLIQDPVVDSIVHFVSGKSVVTISTNAMNVLANKVLRQIGSKEEQSNRRFMSPPNTASTSSVEDVQTTAWISVQVSGTSASGHVALVGAVISGDAELGHVLVSRLSNGSMDAVNMTESRLLHETSSTFGAKSGVKPPVTSETAIANEALKALEATPPFVEVAEPLVKQVVDGLSDMGKIVGGATSPSDITPVELAMVALTKERCENKIVLPLKQLNKITASRMEALRGIHKNQLVQVERLKETVRTLKQGVTANATRLSAAESKAASLSQRSGAVLQASQSFLPTITEAEAEYFSQVKRLDAKCTEWEETVTKLRESCSNLCDSVDPANTVCTVDFTKEQVASCRDLLNGQSLLLENSGVQLKEAKAKIQELAVLAGLAPQDDTTAIQLHGSEQ